MTDLEHMLRKVHKAIFNDKDSVVLDGEKYPIERTSKKGLRCVYYDKYFFVEQNPDKDSHWAEKARKGDKITWAIKGNDFIANIHDGKFHQFKELDN
ncbi:MAG: hypothetical protein EU548_08485 [Promethearchaeota archaeon]|nr:MAG: hypothetical protein EU548_08485 [Candidatus Lokiarchaeota archaeon]